MNIAVFVKHYRQMHMLFEFCKFYRSIVLNLEFTIR
jgi:hypothetical protein